MAEPISLIASLIAFGTAANATSKLIGRVLALKTAPKRLIDVHNKVEEIRVVANIAKLAAESTSITDREASFRFQQLMRRADHALEEARSIIRTRLVENPESLDDATIPVRIKKFRFVREETKFAALISHLSDIHQQMISALNTIATLELLQIRVTLNSVEHRLERSQDVFPTRQVSQDSLGRRVFQLDDEDSDSLQEPSSLVPEPESGLPTESPPTTVLETIARDTTADQGSPSALHPKHNVEPSIPFHADQSSPGQLQASLVITQEPLLDICGCSCHVPLAVRTPSWLGYAVGRLLIRWYKSPEMCGKCSFRSCKAGRKRVLSTQYFFPWWVWQRMIEFESGWNSCRQPAISIASARIIPEDSNVFLFAQHNNIEGVKRLFEQGLASPFDVSTKGRTPLHFAATAVKAEMIEFLVGQRAKTEAEDQDHLSPNDIIWELYLRKPEKRKYILDAAGLSPGDTDSLEKQCFTTLHRVVLGLGTSIGLDDYLRLNCSEIDCQDLSGKTALAWAASRTDPNPVRTLLKHRASVTLADYRYKTPLHYCAGSGAPEAIEMILEVIARTDKGALIEARDDKGRTPLNYATRMDLFDHTRILIAYGADLEATESKSGRTVLLNAIYWNSHRVLPLLLEKQAKTGVRDARGETVLHHLARFGDLETLAIFADHDDFGYVDATAGNDRGLTAVQVFNSADARCSPEAGLERETAVELFSRILRNAAGSTRAGKSWVVVEEASSDDSSAKMDSVHVTCAMLDIDHHSDDGDQKVVFYDAVEELQSEMQHSFKFDTGCIC